MNGANIIVGMTLTADHKGLTGAVQLSTAEIEKLHRAAVAASGGVTGAGASAARTGGAFRDAGTQARSFGAEARRLEQSIGGVHREMSLLYGLIAAGGLGLAMRQIAQASMTMEGFRSTLTAAVGDQRKAAEELAFVEAEAERLGLSIVSLADSYARLAAAAQGTSLAGQGAREIFTAVAEAGAVLKLSAERSAQALRALEQMVSKGTISMEELKLQLGDQLPGAMQIAARSMDMTVEAFTELVASGGLAADEFLPRFAKAIREAYGPGVQEAIKSTRSEVNRTTNDWFRFLNTIAEEGYIDAFNAELREMQQWLKTTDAKELARDVGETLATALQVAGDAALWLADNLELVIGAIGALAAVKLISMFVGMTQAIIAAGAALVGMAAAAPVLAGVAAGVAAVGVAAAASASDTGSAGDAMSNAWDNVKASIKGAGDELVKTGGLLDALLSKASLSSGDRFSLFDPVAIGDAANAGIKATGNSVYGLARSITDSILTILNEPIKVLAGPEFWAKIEQNFRRGMGTDWIGGIFEPLKQETEHFISEFQDGQPIFLDVKLAPTAKAEMSKAVRELIEELNPLIKLYREVGAAAMALEKDFRKGAISYDEYSEALEGLGHRVEGVEYQLGQAARAVRDQAREIEVAARIRRLETEDTEEAREKIIELRAARELEKLELQRVQAVMAAQPGQIAEINAAYGEMRAAILAVRDADRTWSAEQAASLKALQERLEPTAAQYQAIDRQARLLLAALAAGKITYQQYGDLMARLGNETERWANEQDAAARKVREGAEELEFSNAIRRLEIEDTEEARKKIIELTTARELEQLEIERTQALLAAQPEQIDDINAAYDRLKAAIIDDGQVKELERLKAQADPLAKAFENAAEGIQRGFSDAFFKIFREGRLRFSDLADTAKDIFARMLAELATLAIARPVIVPMVTALGGAMGVSASGIESVTRNLGGGMGIADKALSAGRWFSNPFSGLSNIGTNWAAGGLSAALFGQAAGGAAAAGVAPVAGGLTNAATTGVFGFGGQMTAMGALGIAGLAIGAIALASAMFKKKPSDYTASFQGMLDDNRWEATEDKANSETRQLRDQIQQATRTSLDAVTQALNASLPEGFYFDVATGSRDGNRFWVYDTGGESLAGQPLSSRPDPVASGRFDTVEDLIGGILTAVTERVEGLSDTLRTVVEQVDFSDLEAALQDIGLGQFYDSLGQAEPVVAEAQAAIDEINERFRELSEFADRYGLALEPVTEGLSDALADLQSGFIEGLEDQILQMTDPIAYQIRQLDAWREAQLRSADAIGKANGLTGASTEALAKIQELYALQLMEITGEVEVASGRVGTAMRSIYLEQISAVETFMGELERQTERWRRQAATLRAAGQSLLLDANLSPLAPAERYQEARRQFDDVYARAQLGDQDAIDDLPDIAQAFLEVSRAFNGNAVAFSQDFGLVQQALAQVGDVADRHARIGQGQLDQLRSQAELLRQQLETDRLLVTTFEQAVALLTTIAGSIDALGTGGRPAGGGGSATVAYVPGSYGDTVGSSTDLIQGVDRATRDAILASLGQTVAGGGTVQQRIAEDEAFANAYRDALIAAGGSPTFSSGGGFAGGVARIHPGELLYTGPAMHVLNAYQSAAVLGGGRGGGVDMEPVVAAVRRTTDAVGAAGELQARAAGEVALGVGELKDEIGDLRREMGQLAQKIGKLAS